MTISFGRREKLVIANDMKYLSQVRSFTSKMVAGSRLAPREENKIVLAVDEAVTNVIEHGYEPNETGPIEVEIVLDDKAFTVYVRDKAKEYRPNSAREVDIAEHIKAGRKKGLGVYLIRQIMDEVQHNFRDGAQNELKMVKRVPVR